jgi:hypothetical protein
VVRRDGGNREDSRFEVHQRASLRDHKDGLLDPPFKGGLSTNRDFMDVEHHLSIRDTVKEEETHAPMVVEEIIDLGMEDEDIHLRRYPRDLNIQKEITKEDWRRCKNRLSHGKAHNNNGNISNNRNILPVQHWCNGLLLWTIRGMMKQGLIRRTLFRLKPTKLKALKPYQRSSRMISSVPQMSIKNPEDGGVFRQYTSHICHGNPGRLLLMLANRRQDVNHITILIVCDVWTLRIS